MDPERAAGLGPLHRTITPGTSLLVAGPSVTRKARLVDAVLATGHAAGERVTMVPTEDHAGTLGERLAAALDVDPPRSATVDCTDGPSGEGLSGPGRVQHVPSPNDLTGIGIAITRAMEALSVPGGRYRLGSARCRRRSPTGRRRTCSSSATSSPAGSAGWAAVRS